LAERLSRELEFYGFVEEGSHVCSVQIGIALLSRGKAWPKTPGQLLSWAKEACRAARADADIVHRGASLDQEDLAWAKRLRLALANGDFFLLYQPMVSLLEGGVTHYEALLRLRGDNGALHFPGEFIPIAERLGLMTAIDYWVLDKAVAFLGALDRSHPQIWLNINLSPRTYASYELPDRLQEKLVAAGVAAESIIFDVSETRAMLEQRQQRETIERLSRMGCRFALDDFGACASAMNYLRLFPVDYVKFDGKIIGKLIHDETERVLIEAMIDIAHRLGKLTVASFVEDAPTLSLLKNLGVNFVQGYLLGKPQAELLPWNASPLQDVSLLAT
jgi:EAL domain-containing protein (putative c-di-GMP-specific phosphodiesterase class I)